MISSVAKFTKFKEQSYCVASCITSLNTRCVISAVIAQKEAHPSFCNRNRRRHCFPRSQSQGSSGTTGINLETLAASFSAGTWDGSKAGNPSTRSLSNKACLLINPNWCLTLRFHSTDTRSSRFLLWTAASLLAVAMFPQGGGELKSSLFQL